MSMIKQLQRRKSSNKGNNNKAISLLRWTSTGTQPKKNGNPGAMPGDTRRYISSTGTDNSGETEEDVSQLIVQYAQALGYPSSLSAKMQRKFKKHGAKVVGELFATYKRLVTNCGSKQTTNSAGGGLMTSNSISLLSQQASQQDTGCLEELILSAMPDKTRARCLGHVYNSLLRESEFFQTLVRFTPDEQRKAFETRMATAFFREHIAMNRYLAVSPRGAVYIVRRGAVRIFEKGVVVATLERGAMFEVCALSDQFVTLHFPQPALAVGDDGINTKGIRMGRRGSSSRTSGNTKLDLMLRCSSESKSNIGRGASDHLFRGNSLNEHDDNHCDEYNSHSFSPGLQVDNASGLGFGTNGSESEGDELDAHADGLAEARSEAGLVPRENMDNDLDDFLANQNASFAHERGRDPHADFNSPQVGPLFDGSECSRESTAGGLTFGTARSPDQGGATEEKLQGGSSWRRSLMSATLNYLQRRRSSSEFAYWSTQNSGSNNNNNISNLPQGALFVQSERKIKLYALSRLHICAVDLEDPASLPDPLNLSIAVGNSSITTSASTNNTTTGSPKINTGRRENSISPRSWRTRVSSGESVNSGNSRNGLLESKPYPYGVELGMLSSDGLRAICEEFPDILRNFEVLRIQVEVSIEREADAMRRKQEQLRRRLAKEHKLTTNSELEAACRHGSLQRCEEAVSMGAGVNDALDESGAGALHIAALFGHTECLALLLRLGADPARADKEGRTPLHLCCLIHSWTEPTARAVLRLLLMNVSTTEATIATNDGCDNDSCSSSVACTNDSTTICDSTTTKIDQINKVADAAGSIQKVEKLSGMTSSSPLLRLDKWGNTPLHLAAGTGDMVILSVLVSHLRAQLGVDAVSALLTKCNKDGYTALEMCTSLEARRILKPKTQVTANLR